MTLTRIGAAIVALMAIAWVIGIDPDSNTGLALRLSIVAVAITAAAKARREPNP